MLEVEDVSLAVDPHWSWHGVEMALESGTVVKLEGYNGVGKSSLLRLMCGFLPRKNNIMWKKEPLIANKDIYYFNGGSLCATDLSLTDTLESWLMGFVGFCSEKRVDNCLKSWGLFNLRNNKVREISMGQKARLVLSVLTEIEREIWLLDEPFAHLDTIWAEKLESEILKHTQRGGLVILISHHYEMKTVKVAKKWVIKRKMVDA